MLYVSYSYFLYFLFIGNSHVIYFLIHKKYIIRPTNYEKLNKIQPLSFYNQPPFWKSLEIEVGISAKLPITLLGLSFLLNAILKRLMQLCIISSLLLHLIQFALPFWHIRTLEILKKALLPDNLARDYEIGPPNI